MKGILAIVGRSNVAAFALLPVLGAAPALAQTVSIPSETAPVTQEGNRIIFEPEDDRQSDWETSEPSDAGDADAPDTDADAGSDDSGGSGSDDSGDSGPDDHDSSSSGPEL